MPSRPGKRVPRKSSRNRQPGFCRGPLRADFSAFIAFARLIRPQLVEVLADGFEFGNNNGHLRFGPRSVRSGENQQASPPTVVTATSIPFEGLAVLIPSPEDSHSVPWVEDRDAEFGEVLHVPGYHSEIVCQSGRCATSSAILSGVPLNRHSPSRRPQRSAIEYVIGRMRPRNRVIRSFSNHCSKSARRLPAGRTTNPRLSSPIEMALK